ncbi:MAG: hypothetical protein QOJ75_1586 [Chloroflexota bacterium]|jgi:pimeloyl-ACP methyl ester carboxylesterase|nr:hypothetical protein [Chloroflexota bacterium]
MTTDTTAGRQIAGPAGDLHVDDGGAGGLPVVFVHSFGGSTRQWAAQLEHLRRARRAIAFDLRGHGQSAAPRDGDYSVESMAADVGAVVNALDITKVVLVGHGLGAKAALEFAGSDPDRVAGLLLVAAPAPIPAEQAEPMMAAMQSDYEKTTASINARLMQGAKPEVQAVVARDFERIPQDAGLRVMRSSLEHDPLPALARYPGPKAAVTTPEADTPNDVHNLVPDMPHTEVAGTSHWIPMDKPDEFNRILDRFLGQIGAGS